MKKVLLLLIVAVTAASSTSNVLLANNNKPNLANKFESVNVSPGETGKQIKLQAEQSFMNQFNFTDTNPLQLANFSVKTVENGQTIDISNSNQKISNVQKVYTDVSLKQYNKNLSNDQNILIQNGYKLGESYFTPAGILIDLAQLTVIDSPMNLPAAKDSSVTYNEVNNAIQSKVLIALQRLAPPSTLADVTYVIYSDAAGTAYHDLDLSQHGADVYVKVTAVNGSMYFIGASNYVKISLPKASDARGSLSNLTIISSPASVTANDATSVTYSELKASLSASVLAAVKTIAPSAISSDYQYTLYADNKGTAYSNVNLSGRTAKVDVIISAIVNNNVIKNSTSYIEITLPAIKVSIDTIPYISPTSISISPNNEKSVTITEVKAVLDPLISNAIKVLSPSAVISTDYTYQVYSTFDKQQYVNLNVFHQTQIVYIQIDSKSTSTLIKNSIFLSVVFYGTLKSISSITTVNPPADINAVNSDSVTLPEVKDALNPCVLAAVQAIDPIANYGDFTYTISSNNQGAPYVNLNLTSGTKNVWVKITANLNSLALSGQTGYIQVTLPKLRLNLINVKTISNAPVYINSANLSAVTSTELKTALDPLVSQEVTKEIPTAVLGTDYTYTISNQPNSTTYTNIDLHSSIISKSVNVYVQINAVSGSKELLGSSNFIGVAVYGIKTDISSINSIAVPSPVTASDLTAVTQSELSAAISSQILASVHYVEPYATTNDFTVTISNWDGSTYTPVNLKTGYGFVSVVVKAKSGSLILTGQSQTIYVIFPPQAS